MKTLFDKFPFEDSIEEFSKDGWILVLSKRLINGRRKMIKFKVSVWRTGWMEKTYAYFQFKESDKDMAFSVFEKWKHMLESGKPVEIYRHYFSFSKIWSSGGFLKQANKEHHLREISIISEMGGNGDA